jgi:hypothetical protein
MSARTANASPGAATGAVRTGATLMAVAAAGFNRLHRAGRAAAGRLRRPRRARLGLGGRSRRAGLALVVALPAHYPWNLDTLGHLGLVYLATLVFVAGALLSGKGLLDARAANRPPGISPGHGSRDPR